MMLAGANKNQQHKDVHDLVGPPYRDIDLLKTDLRGSRGPFQQIVVSVLVMCCVHECFH